jgi:hypothetical protein
MRRKSFRPGLEGMESRLALSSSSTSFFTEFFDNLFGKSTNSNSSTTPHYTAAQIAQIKAKHAAQKLAHEERLAEFRAAHHLH